jgi:F0F1-type ATP synthase assembly protein I
MDKKPENDKFLLVEYCSLREEIVKRIELEYQILYITLFIFSTMCGFALANKASILILPYPIICVLLTSAWVNSDFSIFHLAEYIKNHIEAKIGEETTGWEHYLTAKKPFLLSTLSVGGTFVSTTLIAIVIGISLAKFGTFTIILLVLDIIGLIYINIIILRFHFIRKNSMKRPNKLDTKDNIPLKKTSAERREREIIDTRIEAFESLNSTRGLSDTP